MEKHPESTTARAESADAAAAMPAGSVLDRVPVVGGHSQSADEEAATPPASVADAATSGGATARVEGAAEAVAESAVGPIGPLPDAEVIREAIKEVIDPEIGINIVDLGLIYDVLPNNETGKVDVNMTLTSPGCPAGPEITSAVWMTVKRMTNVKDCEVNLIWKPRWDPNIHASEEARMFLGIW